MDNPEIPRGLLEAVSFSYTRLQHHSYDKLSAKSCLGLPRTYGVMGLTENGKGYFKHNLTYVSVLSGYSKDELKDDARASILGYAKAYSQLLSESSLEDGWLKHAEVLRTLSELPHTNLSQDFALNSQLYVMFWFLSQPEFQTEFNFPDHQINMADIFGEANYKVLSSSRITLSKHEITANDGTTYSKMPGPCSDYPGSIWVAADASNYSSRSGTSISAITIHDIEGTYAGAISWFQNPSSNVSAHYCLRSIDGQVTQMVCDADKAWHVGTENPYTVGLEHEGKADYEGWYTEAMYQSSADVCLDAMDDYGIDPMRSHEGPPEYGITTLGGCIKLKGHQHYANSTHRDPGLNWDWEYFYRLLNDASTPTPTSVTASSGTVYDSGGSGGNYGDDERLMWVIEPPGATSVTINFTQFDLEVNWDYLYLYDGSTLHDDFIGVYTGTSSPGTVTAESGKLLIEFRSDCATTNPGWEATYTSTTTPLSCPVPTSLVESDIIPVAATLSWSGTASSYVLRYRDHTYNPWTYVPVTGTSYSLSGLSSNSEYYWGVASLCSGDTSSFAGSFFTTPASTGSFSINECDGTFRDSGGPLGVYIHGEDYEYTINASGPITVSFSSFNVEAAYDFLYVHDGSSTGAPQIAGSPFSGTTTPGTFTSSGNSITFRFTSDNSTNDDGWEATWTCAPVGPPTPSASFTSTGTNVCSADSIQLINTSTDATSYIWDIPGGTPSSSTDANPWVTFGSSGTYSVTLIANGAGGADTTVQNLNVAILASPTAGAIPSNSTVFLPSATVTFTNVSSDATSYYWDFGNGNSSTDTNPWSAYDSSGTYTVMLIATNADCGSDTTYLTIEVMDAVGIDEFETFDATIYPNPSTDDFELVIQSKSNEVVSVRLLDLTGRVVSERKKSITTGSNHMLFERTKVRLSAGTYLIVLQGELQTSSYKVILE